MWPLMMKSLSWLTPKNNSNGAVKQYTGQTQEKSLADNQRFFSQVSKKDRQENALTLWADTDRVFTKVTEMFGDGWMPEELVMAQTFLDPANMEELMGTLALQSDGVKVNVKLNLKDSAKCLAYNLIHTPPLTQEGFQAVPSDAVALVSLCLSGPDSQPAAMFSAKLEQATVWTSDANSSPIFNRSISLPRPSVKAKRPRTGRSCLPWPNTSGLRLPVINPNGHASS